MTNAAELEKNPFDGERVTEAVRIYVASGQPTRAREVIDDFTDKLEAAGEDGAPWRTYLEAIYHLGARDWDAFIETAATLEDPRIRYQAALATRDHQGAIEALTGIDQPSAYDHLVVYLAARRANDGPAAREALETAIALLAEGVTEERDLARCLAGETSPDRALALTLPPEAKTVALFALGNVTGDSRGIRLAKRLNYQLSFERYFIERLGL